MTETEMSWQQLYEKKKQEAENWQKLYENSEKLLGISVECAKMLNENQCRLTELKDTIEEKSREILFLERKKKDLERDLEDLNKKIDEAFILPVSNVINTFKDEMSEARELALKGIEPDTFTKAMEMVDRAEAQAIESMDAISFDI